MSKKFKNIFTLIIGISIAGFFHFANADWFDDSNNGISAGEPQDVVISLQSNPMSNPERACLAVTFARSLSGVDLIVDPEKRPNNVTLFVTLDGVSLADDSVVSRRRFKCETPWGKISLIENLEVFLDDNNNNMVVCPICWKSRYGEDLPDYGSLPGADGVSEKAIGKMMLDAEKILDF